MPVAVPQSSTAMTTLEAALSSNTELDASCSCDVQSALHRVAPCGQPRRIQVRRATERRAPRATRSVAAAPDVASRRLRVVTAASKVPLPAQMFPQLPITDASGSPADPHADRRARTALALPRADPRCIIAWKRCSIAAYSRSRSLGTHAYAANARSRIAAAALRRATRSASCR